MHIPIKQRTKNNKEVKGLAFIKCLSQLNTCVGKYNIKFYNQQNMVMYPHRSYSVALSGFKYFTYQASHALVK